jgi:hypothetical protein
MAILGLPAAADEIVVLPTEFTLSGPAARQPLLVERRSGAAFVGQVRDGVELESSDPAIVRIEAGAAVPVGNGQASITARIDGQAATATVTVLDQGRPQAWSFRNHVQSVLSKTGCNSGACHGAAAGKNGFKLSLRGYDPEFDFLSITRQSRGRRIVPSEPGRSLLLLKPTSSVPHKGGLRFAVDSPEYRVLAEWIAAGYPAPTSDDPQLTSLEILPAHAVLAPDVSQQLIVRAHFSDGKTEDVTRWVKFTSTNETVAQVDGQGEVRVMGYGEGAIVGWYLSHNVVASITVPYRSDVSPDVFAKAERANFIDELVLEKLASLNLPPSPPA